MSTRETLVNVLSEFSADSGLKAELGADNTLVLELGDTLANLVYLPESEQVVLWTTLGFLGADDNADRRLAGLMMCNDCLPDNAGFTLALDRDDDDRVLLHDIRPAGFLDSGDKFAAWIEALLETVEKIRIRMDAEYPYIDDEDLDPVFEEVK